MPRVPETFSEHLGRRRISTIREVAARSGVSVATVSRVFNGYSDVSAETRLRVLAWARKLDYTPNAAARTLVKRRSQLIGVILFTGESNPDLQHPFFLEVLVGLKHSLGADGYDVLLFAHEQPGSGHGPHAYARRARHHGVDGVVVLAVDDAEEPELQKLIASGTPVVAVDLALAGERASYVASDNLGGARLAVRHLHDLGHTRIATIAGLAHTKPAADRLLGYRAELQELGLTPQPGYEAAGDFYMESGEAAMRALLALPEPPTAVFAASDMMAVGAIRAIEDAGPPLPGRHRRRRLRRHPARRARQPRSDHDPPGQAGARRRCGEIARPADRRHGDGAARLRAPGRARSFESRAAPRRGWPSARTEGSMYVQTAFPSQND